MKGGHERSAGEVAIHHNLEYVVMAAVVVEVPEIVVSLVQEVKAVETFDPCDLDFDVEILPVVVEAAAFARILELVHTDRVRFGNNRPVGRVPVNPWNLVGGKLEDLVLDAGPFEREPEDGERKQ